jgi:hypothetical protein
MVGESLCGHPRVRLWQRLNGGRRFAQSAGVLGSALGPFPFGLVHDLYGSYFYAWFVSGAATFLNAAFCWRLMIPPKRKVSPGQEMGTTSAEKAGLLATNDEE